MEENKQRWEKIKQEQSTKAPNGNGEKSVACYEIDYAIANDWLMFNSYGSVAAVENHNNAVMNNVQTNYDDEFNHEFDFVIVTIFVATSNPDPWTPSTDASTFLASFRSWGNAGNFGVTFDNAGIWTDRNFDGSTVGIAYVGGFCNNLKYHALSDYTTTAWQLRVMTSHEIGHNGNYGHDSGGGFIMSPFVNNSNTWSAASLATINSYLQGRINNGCLTVCASGVPPSAAFTADVQDGCVPLVVNFMDNSAGVPTNWSWSFPGGTPSSSTDQNPTVVYNSMGTFDVTLSVTNNFGSDQITQTGFINVNDVPVPSFIHSTNLFDAFFTNTSFNGDSYFWDFGDGNFITDENPTHTYGADGLYPVTLEVTNVCGTTTYQDVVTIVTPPMALFSSDVTSGCEPLTVQFFDQSSSNATSWIWSFPGGTPSTSTAQFPNVTYDAPGTYDVSLTAGNTAGNDTYSVSQYIEVLGLPVSNFTYSVNGNTVTFTNTSEYGDSFYWTFGDGNNSTEENPSHTYLTDGDYTVELIVTNTCDSDLNSQTVSIVVTSCGSFHG